MFIFYFTEVTMDSENMSLVMADGLSSDRIIAWLKVILRKPLSGSCQGHLGYWEKHTL